MKNKVVNLRKHGDLKVLITRSKIAPYAVFQWCDFGGTKYWYQVSKDYVYCKCAYNAMKKLEQKAVK